MSPTVLFEDNHLLVLNKPPLWTTQGAAEGQASLVDWARDYLKRKYCKPGKVYLGIVSRLDAQASGVIVLARTSKAAARLTTAFATRAVDKTYWALVEGAPPDSGVFADWLAKDEAQQRMVLAEEQAPGAKFARLSYRVLRRYPASTWVEIALETGRKHQIRTQFSGGGWPILGDRKYGARSHFPAGIALHACRLAFEHPVRQVPVVLEAPPPESWSRWLS